MPIHHKFDDLTRTLAGGVSRRGLTRSLAAMLPGLAITSAVGAGNRKRGKGNGGSGKSKPKAKGKNQKPNRPRNPTPPPFTGPPDECDTTWPGADQLGERDHCRFIRGQCQVGTPREFCIRDGTKPDGTPTKVAVCCKDGETCCDGSCCPKGHACCRGEHGETCCREGSTCCGGFCCGTNREDIACCDGQCVITDHHRDHCGFCGNACSATEYCEAGTCRCDHDRDECPPGLTWCGNRCVDTQTNPDHCGGCFAFNPNGLKCCGGNLCTYIDGVCCGGTCYPSGWPSCE